MTLNADCTLKIKQFNLTKPIIDIKIFTDNINKQIEMILIKMWVRLRRATIC